MGTIVAWSKRLRIPTVPAVFGEPIVAACGHNEVLKNRGEK